MPDPFRRPCAWRRDPDSERVRFAAARLERHHDAASRLWELCADDAYRDATAIAEEHELAEW